MTPGSTPGKPGVRSLEVVWITGASSGIGAALAREYAASRYSDRAGDLLLILSGRCRDRLEFVADRCRRDGVSVETLPFDVSVPSARREALEFLSVRGVVPDILVNNAGISQRGRATDTLFSVDRDIMETNFFAAVEITKGILPAMVERGCGTVVVVSSVAASIPAPLRTAYNAAKAAQTAFFRTLGNELAGSGVRTMIVIPGFVRTSISENALAGDGTRWDRVDANQAGGVSPERAAGAILRGIHRGRPVVYTGVSSRLRIALLLSRLAPAVLDRVLRKARVT